MNPDKFINVFLDAYKKVGKFSNSKDSNNEEYFEVYWNNYKNETKNFISDLFNGINKGGMFSLTCLPSNIKESNKNIKILKLDDNKYYIISNDFRIHSKFNTKTSLDNDDINDLLSIDIMFAFNLEELKNKWYTVKIDVI